MSRRWLFSAPIDVVVFGGTAVIALALLALGPFRGSDDASWITGVLLVDVAHVWSTAFVVYLDPAEWQRRPALYAGTPIAMFVLGVALYSAGEATFWRAIAYLAVFHFVRQQYGWVMMYRARNGEHDRLGRWLDGAAIYIATLYPLIWWHAHLPRHFQWMQQGDFIAGLPLWTAEVAFVAWVALLAIYVARAIAQLARGQRPSWGKHLIVATTVACWYCGIVASDSDYGFTVTNVFVHGIPYMVLVFVYARAASRERESCAGTTARMFGDTRLRAVVVFLATLWLIAYVEEMLWDRTLNHDRPWLFGGGLDVGGAALVIGPLLAVPQLTHYVLDGFLWRRARNPRIGRLL